MAAAANCKCLIGGQWTEARTDRFGEITNSCTGEVIARVPMCSSADVDAAVQKAVEAFPAWRDLPPPDRARFMFRFQDVLLRHTDELARLVTREHGKTFLETKAS
ncbi:unnamed protein product, partial [marine sediment metagenome]